VQHQKNGVGYDAALDPDQAKIFGKLVRRRLLGVRLNLNEKQIRLAAAGKCDLEQAIRQPQRRHRFRAD
jgi:uncharacterized protein YajQ (UPF0234 family)